MKRRKTRRRVLCTATTGLALLLAAHSFAGVQPVQIGVNNQWWPQLGKDAHLGWVRINIWWKDVQPSPGTWNWSSVDGVVNSAYNKGLNILAILSCPPTWAGSNGHCTKPPLTVTEWKTFVDAVANRYKNKVDAYEIWNEPDQFDDGTNVGWARSHNEPPYYADFVHAAAQAIRQRAPGTAVVAPVLSSRADSLPKHQRRIDLLKKLQNVQYPDGNASEFVDVVSAHANGKDDRGPIHTARDLRTDNLAYVKNLNPRNKNKPVWVTEYGWRSDAVTPGYQRVYICSATKAFTGYYQATETGLDEYKITKAFIYVIKEAGSWGIYYNNDVPKPVVPNYLQKLAFPATQQPAWFFDPPACMSGAPPPECEEPSFEMVSWEELGAYDLADPSSEVPVGFSLLYAGNLSPCCPPEPCVVAPESEPFVAEFGNTVGDRIVFSVSPERGGDIVKPGQVGPHGASWSRDGLKLGVTVSLASGVPGAESQHLVQRLATAFDQRFGETCIVAWEKRSKDDADLPVKEPAAPGRYLSTSFDGMVREDQGDCAVARGYPTSFDLTWAFENGNGSRIEAGAYRYESDGVSSQYAFRGDALHWSGKSGVRYWVADVTGEEGPAVNREELLQVAHALDPSSSLEP